MPVISLCLHTIAIIHVCRYLEPQFCIQMAGSMLDPSPERLPTAATCMNLLKLPPYRSAKAMHDKLLYAVRSAHSFDLS